MTTSPLRAACVVACASVFAGCPDDPPPAGRDAASDLGDAADVAIDAAPARTATLHVDDPTARVVLTAGPDGVHLRVEHPDGRLWLESPRTGTFVEVGTGGPGGNRAPDPRVPDPIGVDWQTPTHVVSNDATRNEVVFDGVGTGRLTVSLAHVEDGVYRVDCAATDAAMLRWNLGADDGQYHGLGERFGPSDARGTVVPMQLHFDPRSASSTNEHHVPVPFFVSTRAYGMFVESRTPGAFDVASTDPSRVSATFETARASVYLFAGAPSRVIAAYTRQTGLPRLPPRWAYGPMHWRNEWANRDQLFEDARRIRAEGIPVTTIWIDNPWQRSYNDSEFDTTRFPDPPGMMRELARMGFKVLLWSTPYLDAVDEGATPANAAERLFVEARDRGFFVRNRATGRPYVSISSPGSAGGMPDSNGAMIDFSSAAASAFWTSHLAPLVDLGVRGFKLDYAEDIVAEIVGSRPGFVFSNGEDERTMHSSYPQGYHAAYQAALAQRAGGDGFLLVRASSWGGQRVADVIWPGDLDNDFRRAEVMNGRLQVGGLPAAVHALTSLAASGFPNFGSDTGGYRGGRPTREVLLRWAEQTALSPILQLGGGGDSHNPWSYDADATAIYRGLARLHNDLVPYLRMHAAAASRDGTPPVRALALAFPDDAGSRAEGDAYLLGDDLYVAPVLEAGATRRRVHVPPGAWVHWFTGAIYRGPMDVDVDAPLGRPPLLMRQGAIIPMLADDVATLSTTDAADVVDLADRRSVLRARIIPAGAREVTLEDGARLAVDESAAALRVDFTPGSESSDLRAELDLAHRGAAAAGPVSAVARAGGAALVMAPDARAVTSGCDGCWHYDAAAGVLRVGVRGAARLEVR